ncbi:Lsr2 family DNA-binding protein [Geodermatophilus amargosae]|uniref:Lsr2 family DNA-binding protein n=1 Tax=Geodermatophilus amargosae TaxID=1296565 RepID=UPI0034DFAAC0
MVPILFFAAAGLLVGGGAGGGWLLWQKGNQAAAKELQAQDAANLKRLLEGEIDLAELKRQAKQAGVDVDAVMAGYEKMKAKQLKPEDVVRLVTEGCLPVPGDGSGKKPSMLPEGVDAVSNAEFRAWARANGHEVKDRGQVPERIKAAYRDAHR